METMDERSWTSDASSYDFQFFYGNTYLLESILGIWNFELFLGERFAMGSSLVMLAVAGATAPRQLHDHKGNNQPCTASSAAEPRGSSVRVFNVLLTCDIFNQ
jgi:hypothetical protein